MYVNQLLFSFD